jgi:hypothetical protein
MPTSSVHARELDVARDLAAAVAERDGPVGVANVHALAPYTRVGMRIDHRDEVWERTL